jgi:2,3-bisphosphoglycerate-independent phosphoglycerate mutase
MDISDVWEELACDGRRIVYLVLDGAAGLAGSSDGKTALQAAHTPRLDRLAAAGSCGLLELVGPGVTPGSGPGHLALFGYDPLRYRIGRGVLSALGIDFPLEPGDLAARVNFATLDDAGRITDRRAGRIDTSLNEQLCAQIQEQLDPAFDGEVFLRTVSEHRAALVLRAADDEQRASLSDALADTDPQQTGVAPRAARPLEPQAEATGRLIDGLVDQARQILAGRKTANGLLLRGFQRFEPLPSLEQRFGLAGLCLAQYPMYRGLSRLLGMDLIDPPADFAAQVDALQSRYNDGHGLYFLHVKGTDKAGEDGDFDAKVAVLESVDTQLGGLLEMQPDVLAVTADHSTPSLMAAHSWHPVPVVLHSPYVRRDEVRQFDELACSRGALGLRPGMHLMGLALANAGRLRKFGA